MLNEHAAAGQDFPVKRPIVDPKPYTPDPFSDLRNEVAAIMEIADEYSPREDIPDDAVMMVPHDRHLRVFEGRILGDSETAYAQLDKVLAPHDQLALFRNCTDSPQGSPHEIHIVTGRVSPVEGRPWLNLVLFIVTSFSVLFAGASYGIAGLDPELQRQAIQEVVVNGQVITVIPRLSEIWRGYPYALSLMLILGAHELGHYFAARRHGHSVSLPYFIPLPLIGLGTMGAVIRSREPMRNRKVLVDIGAAGPLAGMVFAVPILIIGLLTSDVELITSGGLREGNSLLYALLKIIALGQFYPTATQDVVINQMAFAGWLGLFVTALNLIPVGQLDGGHVMYSLIGRYARRIYYPVLVGMVVLALISQMWLIWVIILMFIGRLYAPPLDDVTPLDPPRRVMALVTLAIFVLVFVPIPFTQIDLEGDAVPEATVEQVAPSGALTLGD
jgi:membrane-associated protease RseP (regulator of RpoE activity)